MSDPPVARALELSGPDALAVFLRPRFLGRVIAGRHRKAQSHHASVDIQLAVAAGHQKPIIAVALGPAAHDGGGRSKAFKGGPRLLTAAPVSALAIRASLPDLRCIEPSQAQALSTNGQCIAIYRDERASDRDGRAVFQPRGDKCAQEYQREQKPGIPQLPVNPRHDPAPINNRPFRKMANKTLPGSIFLRFPA